MESLIKAIRNYVPLSEGDAQLVKQLFCQKELKENDFLLKVGEVCKDFVFVEKGLFCHCINNDGSEETFYFSAEGDFICDYESFLSKTPSKKNIFAVEDAVVYTLSYQHMQEFYQKISMGDRFGRLFLEQTFVKAINHIVSTLTGTAEQRYLNFLKSFSHIEQRIPQYYIASFIGVTPQSLSRIRRLMVNKWFITLG